MGFLFRETPDMYAPKQMFLNWNPNRSAFKPYVAKNSLPAQVPTRPTDSNEINNQAGPVAGSSDTLFSKKRTLEDFTTEERPAQRQKPL